MKVCIDPGHSGAYEPGACAAGFTEADLNLKIARVVGDMLSLLGHDVFYTRQGEVQTDDLSFRAALANEHQADIFISIHCNAAESQDARGFEVYHCPSSTQGRVLAEHIRSTLARLEYTKDRGVKQAAFQVLRETAMPAVLIECGFITSEADRAFIADPGWQRCIGLMIAAGVNRYSIMAA